MDIHEGTGDENAIRALIGAHFQGLKWTPTTRADWTKFAADFLPDASLFPAARPARAKTLDAFIEAMKSIAKEAEDDPEKLQTAPHTTAFGRLDEVQAAKDLVLCCRPTELIHAEN